MGPSPIGWQDIAAFAASTGTPLNAWEIEMVELIDDAFLQEVNNTMLLQSDPERVKDSTLALGRGHEARQQRRETR